MVDRGDGVGAIVFDLGGVLIDWDPRYLYRKVFTNEVEMEDFLKTVATSEWHIEQDRGRKIEDATALLLSWYPQHEREILSYYGRWDEMFYGPISGSVEVLREVRGTELPLYALTNWSAEVFPLARRQYDFLKWFDDIIVSGEERAIKPDREIYDVLIERTSLNPATTVFIDDSRPNVLAAEDLGFIAIEFQNSDKLREELVRLEVLPALPASSKGPMSDA